MITVGDQPMREDWLFSVMQVIIPLSLLGLVCWSGRNKAASVQPMYSWDQLKAMDGVERKRLKSLNIADLCEALPEELIEEDMETFQLVKEMVGASERCLKRTLLLLISKNLSASHFRDYAIPRRDWVPEEFWSQVFAAVRKHTEQRFPEYYMALMGCFPFIEAMAPHFRPAFDGFITEPYLTIIKLTPMYFILKNADSYSNRLRVEFKTILEPRPEESLEPYLVALELYLKESRYLKRAMLNEKDYYNLNEWLFSTFVNGSQNLSFIFQKDLHRVAFIGSLKGATPEMIAQMVSNCAFKCLALYIGLNQPEYLRVKSACLRIRVLLAFYNSLLVPPRDHIVPCRRPTPGTPIKEIPLNLGLLMDTGLSHEDVYSVVEMTMQRAFEISFDFVSFEEWNSQKDILSGVNDTLRNYCDAFDLEPAIAVTNTETTIKIASRHQRLHIKDTIAQLTSGRRRAQSASKRILVDYGQSSVPIFVEIIKNMSRRSLSTLRKVFASICKAMETSYNGLSDIYIFSLLKAVPDDKKISKIVNDHLNS